jgi:hypothetical protein
VNCRKYIILGAFFKCPTSKLKDAYMGNLALVGNTGFKASICKALMIAYQDDNVNNELVRNICERYHQVSSSEYMLLSGIKDDCIVNSLFTKIYNCIF